MILMLVGYYETPLLIMVKKIEDDVKPKDGLILTSIFCLNVPWDSLFQSHCGLILTAIHLLQRQIQLLISIPLWSDFNQLHHHRRPGDGHISIPLWSDFNKDKTEYILFQISNFNPTVV